MKHNIAVFLGELQLDSQRKVLDGIITDAEKDGNNVFIYSVTLSNDKMSNLGEQFIAATEDFDMYDGCIIYAESIYNKEVRQNLIDKLLASNKPIASIDCPIEGMINISSNNELAMRDLAKHVINEHHVRKINYIGGPESSIDAIIRKTVLREEMKNADIEIDERRFFVGDFYARSGRRAVEYFEKNNLLDADIYVCANDQMALGAYYALVERGIKVPEDALMTGYDYINEAANHYPEITSVRRFEEKIGKAAYKNIVNKIQGLKYETKVEILSENVYSESCGCSSKRPLSHKTTVNNYVNRILREARYADMVSAFSAESTGVTEYQGICSVLESCMHHLGGEKFTACFFDEPNEPEVAKLCYQYADGVSTVKKNVKSTVIADIIKEDNGGNFYAVNSIHYSDKCYGYTVIKNSKMPLYSEFYRIFTINLGNALEHVNNYIKMQEMIKTLDEMWVFDPMTHIYNRAGFYKFADKLVEEAREEKRNLFLLFLDLDGLKKVNDEFGHETGDQLICDMADILRKCRDKNELLMRYGGDEFVVLGEGFDTDMVNGYIKRIQTAMEEKNKKGNRKYKIGASIGYHLVSCEDKSPLSKLIDLADQEMYIEKREKHKLNQIINNG